MVIRCLIIESLSMQRGNRNYFMKSSDGIIENTVSLKMLKYNSCKRQSYGISWSFFWELLCRGCSSKKMGCVWKSCMVQVMVNNWSCDPYYKNLGKKISVTQEMYSVPRIVNSEHYSERRIDMSTLKHC